MREWLVLAAVGAGTYLMRVAFLLPGRGAAPAPVRRALPHIGPAVLGALVTPALLLPAGDASVLPTLAAAFVCALVWWRSRNTPVALVTGLLTAWAALSVL
ncbi:AzlD domain-containing protein [Dactylosporangium sucinum]|uniref:Branched-chain amino acid ABC transporter n=1 Tax=Dactylosporangium sucinum TaxID=1424081 RepID=A0A917TGF2_9ACTN|nr:AzlD domain-containing protein [Dactylosporangium sucinum]GGM21463.1 hypothetical protein GCM10007977_023200 [Dactylosporangium sucinum]